MIPSHKGLFLPYQLKWINDKAKMAICEKTRRNGITFAESYRAVQGIFDNIRNGTPRNYNYIAQKESSATEFLKDVIKFAALFNQACKAVNSRPICDLAKATQEIVPFVDGSVIRRFSSNPDSLRGMKGDLTIDEAAFAPDGQALENAAFPITDTMGSSGNLRIISTHNGSSSWFNRILEEVKSGRRPGWSLHRYDIYDSIKDGMALKNQGPHLSLLPDRKACDKAFLEYLKSKYLGITWPQEFECKPMSSGQTLVSGAEYDNLAIADGTNSYPDIAIQCGNLYVGVDYGINDMTVIWIIEERYNPKVENINLRREFLTRHVITLKGVRTQEQQDIVAKIMKHPSVVMGYMDQGTFGLTITEYLMKTTGKVKGISFGAPMKKILAEQVRKHIEQERISLPKDRNDIKEDVCCCQITYSEAGTPSYGGRSSVGHADAFWALSLALQAAEENTGSYAKGVIN